MTKKLEEKEFILITSFMKNISKENIVRDVMNTFYKLHCVGMKMNGVDPKRKSKKENMTKVWGIKYDPRERAFYLVGKKFMDYTFTFDNANIGIECHLYNIHDGREFTKEEIAENLKSISVEKVDFSDVEKSLARALAEDSEANVDNSNTTSTKPVEKVEPKKVVVEKTPEEKAIERELKTIDWQKKRLKEQYEKLIPQKDLRNIAYYQIYYIAEVKKMIESLKELGYDYVEEDETFMFDSLEKLSNDFNIIRRMSDEEYKNFCENFFSTDNYDLRNIL